MNTFSADQIYRIGKDIANDPELAASSWQTAGFAVSGTLAARPGANFTLEVFASRTAGIDGLGESEVFVGKMDVTGDASGNASCFG
ncbi:MAG: hypothetical protein H7346_01650, partial [Burkholderiaceae bacterium]|nr:hypothetical protein [Burkholderiaceae bacterium]